MIENSLILLWLHVAAAVWFDLDARRIPNVLILSGLAQGLVVALLEGGLPGFGAALLAASAGMFIFFPFFLMRLVGAGDAKLLGVVAAFTGAQSILPIVVFTFLVGGLLGIAALLAARTDSPAIGIMRNLLFAASTRARDTPSKPSAMGIRSTVRIPYAVAIAGGLACWTAMRG